MISDAEKHHLDGTPHPIALDDVRKVLSAGCPVHVAINTGPAFSQVGRDGQFNAAEAASGQHGRHAMLIVGYTGNFFIVKNSWGESGAIRDIAISLRACWRSRTRISSRCWSEKPSKLSQ